ncbi:LPP20 family lipoprotein [Vreelandella rituensis]|uniref:LPP20 lipoprotein n=1 Tax=Vreelandella rituensis TaxID=2282306 RepID=A0A368UAR8_9GAMM|nr:LPP20 family lipoprotein [Halomonas rituensis]RCV93607.1 hypothetical protein DU506_00185 [Halomonas rituensis]
MLSNAFRRTLPHALLIVSLGGLLAGCSTPSATEKALAREAALHERDMKRDAQASKARLAAATQQIERLPDWMIVKPAPDSTGMYGVGIGESETLMLALRKANLEARFDVAKEINQVLSAEETSIGGGDEQYKSIVNTFVDSVNLSGVADVDRSVQASPAGYRVYTLVKLPFPEFNKAMQAFNDDGFARAAQNEMASAYEQLMTRVNDSPAYEPTEVEVDRNAVSLIGDPEATPDAALVKALQQAQAR